MHLPIPAGAHDLRQGAGIVAIGLVRHRLHRRIGGPRLDADRRQTFGAQFVMKPGRQRTRFQTHPFHRQIDFPQGGRKRLRLARRTHFLHDPAGFVDHTDRGLFQRYVKSGKILHGCSFPMFVALQSDHVLTSRQEQPPSFGSAETPITPSVPKLTGIAGCAAQGS
jgi:hypothetical protein